MKKLLTLNTHSLQESDQARKQKEFVDLVLLEKPDIIALQEVNQLMEAPEIEPPAGYQPLQNAISLKEGNHAAAIASLLEKAGVPYYFTWLPVKVGYSKYDEGLALFSRKPILEAEEIPVSTIQDYANYRTRKIPGIRTEDGWFYSTHMSWWKDPDEPFKPQWERLQKAVEGRFPVYLMGDFNGDAAIRNETYDQIAHDGWLDTWKIAQKKDAGWTVSGTIDGWRDQQTVDHRRIDQIWTNDTAPVLESRVVFNGEKEPVVSDHFGILVEIGETAQNKG